MGEMLHAAGPFDVTITPLDPEVVSDGVTTGRMRIEKVLHGDLHATSRGEMLTAVAGDGGSAVYVAVERITGLLGGRRGAFAVHHVGTMTPEGQSLAITIVPGSGSGELTGISGTMGIEITDEKHEYSLEYSLPAPP